MAQRLDFVGEISPLRRGKTLPKGKVLLLHPFLGKHGLLKLGGRAKHLGLPFSQCHPIILYGNHILTKLKIHTEHLRLLHTGPTVHWLQLPSLVDITYCEGATPFVLSHAAV